MSNKSKINVLIGGLVYCATYMGKRWYDPERFLVTVLDVLSEHENFQITVRYRERVCFEYFKWIFDNYFPKKPTNVIFQDGAQSTFIDEIEKHDIYITNDSTSVFEAALAGKYCIAYLLEAQRLDSPFDGSSKLMVSRTPQELRTQIYDILNQEKYTRDFNERAELQKFLGPFDRINERIYMKLSELSICKLSELPAVQHSM
jgi:hypothetical protein